MERDARPSDRSPSGLALLPHRNGRSLRQTRAPELPPGVPRPEVQEQELRLRARVPRACGQSGHACEEEIATGQGHHLGRHVKEDSWPDFARVCK